MRNTPKSTAAAYAPTSQSTALAAKHTLCTRREIGHQLLLTASFFTATSEPSPLAASCDKPTTRTTTGSTPERTSTFRACIATTPAAPIPCIGSNTASPRTPNHTPYCVRGPGRAAHRNNHAPPASKGTCHSAFAIYSTTPRSIISPPSLPHHAPPPPISSLLSPTPPR